MAGFGSEKLSKRTQWIIAAAVFAVSAVFVTILHTAGAREPVITVTDSQVQIKSMFGQKIDFLDITGVTLIEQSLSEIMPNSHRRNGADVGGALKGHFSIGDRRFMLFVRKKSAPTIWLEREGGDVYISLKDGEKTRALYSEIISAWS